MSESDPMRWVWRGVAGATLVLGWIFILYQNKFHITVPVVVIGLGYLAVVATVANLWRVGASAVAPEDNSLDAWSRPIGARGELEKEKKTLLKAIKESEFDLEMGKLSKADADELIRMYRARAIEVIKELDRMEEGNVGTARDQIKREIQARLAIEKDKAQKKDKADAKVAEAEAKAARLPRRRRPRRRRLPTRGGEGMKAAADADDLDDADDASADGKPNGGDDMKRVLLALCRVGRHYRRHHAGARADRGCDRQSRCRRPTCPSERQRPHRRGQAVGSGDRHRCHAARERDAARRAHRLGGPRVLQGPAARLEGPGEGPGRGQERGHLRGVRLHRATAACGSC